MYSSHSALVEPPDETVLWRYMDLSKYLALLEYRELYFPRVTCLEDPFEGHLSKPTIHRIRTLSEGLCGEEVVKRKALGEQNIRTFSSFRHIFCVSCWHMSEVESDAMWGRYSERGDCIAVRSSFARFKKSLASADQEIHGTEIRYIDYDREEIDECQAFNWVRHKRKEFEQDREFRGIYMGPSNGAPGESVVVDVEELLDEVVVSPSSPSWLVDLVFRVTSRFGVDISVSCSKLSSGPSYISDSG